MVFSSLFFVFVFLLLNLIIYFFVDEKYKNIVLLVFSLVFYSWGGPRYLFLLVGETFVSWICSIGMEKNSKNKKIYLWIDVIIMLGLLCIFKYLGFILGNIHAIIGIPKVVPNIALPIGISFYTFQLLSYDIDVYKGQVKAQEKFWKLLLYSSLFHQCIAGPIVRYQTVAEEIDHRTITFKEVYLGFRRFCIGLAKKAILANSCAAACDALLPAGKDALQSQSVLGLWLGMIFFTLQIYLDFSAYSDMAIGMGRMVGFHYLENFNYPYLAKSIQDFWRRWHISLSTFFRDYVYIPLGGSRCDQKIYMRNVAVVWFLTGLWHGASWNYIFWGLYYLGFLLLEKFVIRGRIPKGLDHVYTLIVVVVGWTIFKFENVSEMFTVLVGMIGFAKGGFTGLQAGTVFMGNIYLLIFSIIACTKAGVYLHNILYRLGKQNGVWFWIYNVSEVVVIPMLLILSFIALIGNSYNPFLYFQF